MKTRAVVLFGGGLDAAAMVELFHYDHDLILLYIDYGAKAAPGERKAMDYFSKKYGIPCAVIDLPPHIFPPNPIIDTAMTADHKDDYLPGRNMLLAMVAFPFAVTNQAQEIWLGAAPTDDPYMLQWARDMQQPFVDGFNVTTAFAYGIDTPRLRAPLLQIGVTKEAYVRLTLRGEPKLFSVTHSCYQGASKPCGVCAHCVYREALRIKVGG